ncbi:hypothetical protein BBJ28_00017149, partial [Nothophytophthora sp. Chile5]
WGAQNCTPWPAAVRQWTLTTIRVADIRAKLLPVHNWILPTTSIQEPAQWNVGLITVPNVEAFYATKPWQYLAEMVPPLTFGPTILLLCRSASVSSGICRTGRAPIGRLLTAFLFPTDPELNPLRADAKQRRSHAGGHFTSVLKLVIELFQAGMDDLNEHPAFTIPRLKEKFV